MPAYIKGAAGGLWRGFRPAAVASIAVVALTSGGCSTSYQLGDLAGRDARAASTSASAYAPSSTRRASVEEPQEADLVIAKAAATELLARGGADSSQSWENPRTGARGTVTPIAANYVQDGVTCRDFLASHVRGSQEAWYQGGACRKGVRWEVRDLRPLRRS
jgi:hypothetical protein